MKINSVQTYYPVFTGKSYLKKNNTFRNAAIAATIGATTSVGLQKAYLNSTKNGLDLNKLDAVKNTIAKFLQDNQSKITKYTPAQIGLTSAMLVTGFYLAGKTLSSIIKAISDRLNNKKS